MIIVISILLHKNLVSENFASGLAQANLASKNDIAAFVKKTNFVYKLKSLNKKITSNKTKHVLVKNELKYYRRLTQVFLSVKFVLIMMHNFI